MPMTARSGVFAEPSGTLDIRGATALALSKSLGGLAQAAAAGPVKRLLIFYQTTNSHLVLLLSNIDLLSL